MIGKVCASVSVSDTNNQLASAFSATVLMKALPGDSLLQRVLSQLRHAAVCATDESKHTPSADSSTERKREDRDDDVTSLATSAHSHTAQPAAVALSSGDRLVSGQELVGEIMRVLHSVGVARDSLGDLALR